MIKSTYTDRSRIVAYQRCPRRRWYEYHYNGHGIVPASGAGEAIDLGSAVDRGLEYLLGASMAGKPLYPIHIEHAVRIAVEGLNLEGAALAEALVRGWAAIRLLDFLTSYRVVEVQYEDQLALTPSIILNARADGLLATPEDDLLVLSVKTCRKYDSRKAAQGLRDVQGLSEQAAIAARLGKPCLGVKMEYLVTGPMKDGHHQTPLLGGWMRETSEGLYEYAAAWKYEDPITGAKHTLGPSWVPFNAWEEMGIKEWIEWLALNEPALLAAQFISPEEYYREHAEIDSWQRQVTHQETRIEQSLAYIGRQHEIDSTYDPEDVLDGDFPQYRHSCDYPSSCPYLPICPNIKHVPKLKGDPMGSGAYVARTPHHPEKGK